MSAIDAPQLKAAGPLITQSGRLRISLKGLLRSCRKEPLNGLLGRKADQKTDCLIELTLSSVEQAPVDNETIAGISAAPMFMCAAIVGALKQAGLIDPLHVVALVENFASGSTDNLDAPPDAIVAMRARLLEFGEMIRSMATMPYGAGRS